MARQGTDALAYASAASSMSPSAYPLSSRSRSTLSFEANRSLPAANKGHQRIPDAVAAHRYLDAIDACGGVHQAIQNVATRLTLENIQNEWVPVTVNQTEYDNSYVCSPYTAYISYARDELGLLNNVFLETALKGVIGLGSLTLKQAKINQTVSLNNWLVSTNLVPDWSEATLQTLVTDLTQRYPDHSLSLRSLNARTDGDMMARLKAHGWLLIPARQVYLFDNENTDWWKRNNCKNDQRLLRKTILRYAPASELEYEDFADIERIFTQLFIDKHSAHNPQFSTEFLYHLHTSGLVDFHTFRDSSGQVVGAIGVFTQRDIITTPILGYDTRLPKSLGLYRLLMAVLLKHTYESGKLMNLSSGAAEFKRMRGGQPHIEYTAFYVKHLPPKRRHLMQAFAGLVNRTAPNQFEKHQL